VNLFGQSVLDAHDLTVGERAIEFRRRAARGFFEMAALDEAGREQSGRIGWVFREVRRARIRGVPRSGLRQRAIAILTRLRRIDVPFAGRPR
jgi:hypothetical protein